MITLAILHSTIRKEEKLIITAAQDRSIKIKVMDIRKEIFNPDTFKVDFDIALERSLSTVKGTHAATFLESQGVPVINSTRIARVCEDKFWTSLRLAKANIPTPKFALVFNSEQALEAVENLGGFPVVLKPTMGSWGRLLARINDRDSLEAILEHKDVLGSPQQKAFYIQEYIDKFGRDIRAFVMDGIPICAIYRESSHWITNTARGAVAKNCPLDEDLRDICRRSSEEIGGGLLAIDIFETEEGYKINEVNHTMEFRNSEEPTGVNIAREIVDYCLRKVNERQLSAARSCEPA